jgi:hypothetical protein
MWRPEEIGTVIAERKVDVFHGRKRSGSVVIRFGLPVREPNPGAHAPWFCPLSISGAGIRFFVAVAGHDSLQSLVLALELATTVVPVEVGRVGARAEWLGDGERLVFARHSLAVATDNALLMLLAKLREISEILDPGTRSPASASARAQRTLKAIGASAGGRIASRPKKAVAKKASKTPKARR